MSRRSSFRQDDPEWLRHMMELAICFVIAVIVLRGFVLEGYLISTGSMAPGLRGLHKQLHCPSCQYSFAFGVSFDESAGSASDMDVRKQFATCPNCGQININAGSVPKAHGDQLLVQKGVFDFRNPRRWETIVFLNPASPGEAYVKRVVGLPGESVQVIDGDLFINGVIARKDLETQRDMRIPVFDMEHMPLTEDWQFPWALQPGWKLTDGQLSFQPDDSALGRQSDLVDRDGRRWLKFQWWRRASGIHVCEVPVPGDFEKDWQVCLTNLNKSPVTWTTRLTYDRDRQVLRMKGVMPYEMQTAITSWPTSPEFRAAVYRLGALSHASPVTDRYGYNSLVSSPEYPVHDLMLESSVSWDDPPELISFQIPMNNDIYRLDFSPAENVAKLVMDSTQQVIANRQLDAIRSAGSQRMKIELSNFDRRVIVAIDGVEVFEFLDLPRDSSQAAACAERFAESDPVPDVRTALQTSEVIRQQSRTGIGVKGAGMTVESLRLYRDVHYTPGRRTNAVDSVCVVEPDNYFVQGDNSPVSSDSRNWPDPFVPHHLLIGKPFVVHLPSKPGKLTIGGVELPIRIPDLQRIRYIH